MQVLKGQEEENALKLIKQLNGKNLASPKYFSKHSTSVPKTARRWVGIKSPVWFGQKHWSSDPCPNTYLVPGWVSGSCLFSGGGAGIWQRPADILWLLPGGPSLLADTGVAEIRTQMCPSYLPFLQGGGLRRAVWPIRHNCPFMVAVLVFGQTALPSSLSMAMAAQSHAGKVPWQVLHHLTSGSQSRTWSQGEASGKRHTLKSQKSWDANVATAYGAWNNQIFNSERPGCSHGTEKLYYSCCVIMGWFWQRS